MMQDIFLVRETIHAWPPYPTLKMSLNHHYNPCKTKNILEKRFFKFEIYETTKWYDDFWDSNIYHRSV